MRNFVISVAQMALVLVGAVAFTDADLGWLGRLLGVALLLSGLWWIEERARGEGREEVERGAWAQRTAPDESGRVWVQFGFGPSVVVRPDQQSGRHGGEV